MSTESSLRADIVEVGRRMYARGYTASNDGNISVRLGADRLLMTPKSVCKGFMTPDMMCITDLDGRSSQGDRDPSSEMLMHLEVYRQRPDVQAVVHAHPPTATGFAVAGIPLDRAVLAEVLTTLGSIPIAEYATPSTSGAAGGRAQVHQGARRHAAREPRRADRRRAICSRAYYKMETIEHFAKISLVARLLGRENLLVARGGGRGCRSCAARTASRRRRRFAPDPATRPTDDRRCQVVAGARPAAGARLVPDASRARRPPTPDGEGEIRLTYRELSALIEDAIRSLR